MVVIMVSFHCGELLAWDSPRLQYSVFPETLIYVAFFLLIGKRLFCDEQVFLAF